MGYARSLQRTEREIPFILMPYPIFKDATGKELHFIGRDKVDLDGDKRITKRKFWSKRSKSHFRPSKKEGTKIWNTNKDWIGRNGLSKSGKWITGDKKGSWEWTNVK